MFRRVFWIALFALFAVPFALADAPTVTAVLNSSETVVGRPVQLQIKITGDSSATPPREIEADGLQIRYSGQSQLIESRNFHMSYSFVYSYTILPMKAGTFTIPAQTIQTSGGEMGTPALTLNVSPNDSLAGRPGRGRSNAGGSAVDENKLVFAELIVPKTSAYVGEMVPVIIRLGFNSRVRSGLAEGPTLTGEGFTTQRMPQPKQSIETVDGTNYQVVTYKTAIAAARSGKFEIGPVEAKAVVQVPRRAGSGGRSPSDIFGLDDPFNDPFFSDPFAGIPEQRQIEFKSKSASLEVKPLPSNAPPGFGGAVGIFSLTTDVNPKRAQVGDPLTVTANLSGRGNFDRVTAPGLAEERGWHTYPPNANFKADDDVGISGTKTFEMVLTPNENKQAVPPLTFSFFDPLKDSYVTLKSDELPVVIEGGLAPAPAVAALNASATPTPIAQPTPTPVDDILYQLTDEPQRAQTFQPLFMRPEFWAAQAVPFLGLIGFFAWKTRQRRRADREGQRLAAWTQETVELQKKLRRTDEPPDAYFAGALRMVQLKTALARRVEPNTVDAEAAISAFQLDDEKRDRVRELFRQGDELRYSGRQNGHGVVTEQTQREVLDLVENLS